MGCRGTGERGGTRACVAGAVKMLAHVVVLGETLSAQLWGELVWIPEGGQSRWMVVQAPAGALEAQLGG